MKKTIVVYGSSTGTCEAIAQSIAEKLGVDVINVTEMDENTIKVLLLGAKENCKTIGLMELK